MVFVRERVIWHQVCNVLFCEAQAGAVGPNGRGYALFVGLEWHDKNRAPMAHSSPPSASADHISYLLQIVPRFCL